jgi:hypothetical protein
MMTIKEFFGEMEISETEKKRREELADDLLILFLLFFSEVEAENVVGNKADIKYYEDMLYRQYSDDVETYIVLVAALLGGKKIPETLKEDIKTRIKDIVNTTFKFKDEYYTSKDRATLLACNEANYVCNNTEYHIAKYQGYRHKKWVTMRDEKVRATHALADGQTIDIGDYFKIGQAEMLYPMDMSRNAPPEEVIGCRCSIVYLR